MKQDYSDITSRLGKPMWWDEAGCPRYEPFQPAMANDFYAHEVALLHVTCQGCGAAFHVCASCGVRDQGPFQVRPQPLDYGDPPRDCCWGGASTSSETVEVLELWVKQEGKWITQDPRKYFAAAMQQRACAKWRRQTLKALKICLTPVQKSSPKIWRPSPGGVKRSAIMKRLTKLGAPPANFAKFSTYQLARALYYLESGEPS